MMAAKLGIELSGERATEAELGLLVELEEILMNVATDITIFYRRLANLPDDKSAWLSHLNVCLYNQSEVTTQYQESLCSWLERYITRCDASGKSRAKISHKMNATNPKYVLRNYLAQQAIELVEQQDYALLHQLQQVLSKPYDEQSEFEHFAKKRPEWKSIKQGVQCCLVVRKLDL